MSNFRALAKQQRLKEERAHVELGSLRLSPAFMRGTSEPSAIDRGQWNVLRHARNETIELRAKQSAALIFEKVRENQLLYAHEHSFGNKNSLGNTQASYSYPCAIKAPKIRKPTIQVDCSLPAQCTETPSIRVQSQQGWPLATVPAAVASIGVFGTFLYYLLLQLDKNTEHAVTSETDPLTGTNGDDILRGFESADVLLGKDGNDELFGEGGNDILSGGAGSDYLVGGAGADVFVFGDREATDIDIVADFEVGTDTLQFEIFDPASGTGPFGNIDEVKISDVEEGTLIEYHGHQIVLTGVQSSELSADDFTFI